MPERPKVEPKVVADVKELTEDSDVETVEADSGDDECAKFRLATSLPSAGLVARRLVIGS
jgi:hypothetical protein